MRNPNQKKEPDSFSGLRERAEAILSSRKGTINEPDFLDVKRLLTELPVQQSELEIQNEEMRRAQLQLVAEHEKYADLYNFAPVAYFTFDGRDRVSVSQDSAHTPHPQK